MSESELESSQISQSQESELLVSKAEIEIDAEF